MPQSWTPKRSSLSVRLFCLPVDMNIHQQLFLSLQADKNLRESSDDTFMELSQKQFGSVEQHTDNLLHHQILQTAEVLLLLLPHTNEVLLLLTAFSTSIYCD